MSKIKKALLWLKENIWMPLSAVVLLLLSILLLRKPNRQLLSTISQNRELQKQELDVVNKVNEETNQKAEEQSRKTKEKVKKVKSERKKKIQKIDNEKKEMLEKLSKQSNEELAEMLKKDDEV